MSRLDPYDEIEYSKPPPLPEVVLKKPYVPVNVTLAVNQLVREALRLQQSGPVEFVEAPFMRLVSNLMKLQKLVEPSLPGMGEEAQAEVAPAKKARCSEWEARSYCKTLGLPEDDGSWFVAKMEGVGWKVGGSAVKDAFAVIRSWRLAGHMASQKVNARAQAGANGAPVPKNHVTKELDQQLARARKGLL